MSVKVKTGYGKPRWSLSHVVLSQNGYGRPSSSVVVLESLQRRCVWPVAEPRGAGRSEVGRKAAKEAGGRKQRERSTRAKPVAPPPTGAPGPRARLRLAPCLDE